MGNYESNTTISDMAQRLLRAKHVLLTTHQKPDGDAIGSVLALARALMSRGISADIYLMGPVEPNLSVLAGPTPYSLVENEMPVGEYDLIVVADTGSFTQLEPLERWLRDRSDRVIGFDHHVRGDAELSVVRIVDPTKASTTQLLIDVIDAMDVPMDGRAFGIAEALFIGLATDTGWFRYANADAEAFSVAAQLLDRGVEKTRLYQLTEETHRPERLKLTARALSSLELTDDGAVAIMSLTTDDFELTGGTLEDITGVVNEPMVVSSVRASVLLTELESGITKLSFRSKPAGRGESMLDVNVLAQEFGGGGHVHAAGARVKAGIEQTKLRLLEALRTVAVR